MSKINKKKVVTFQLVSRSYDDPENANPEASEHVLVPIHIGDEVDPALVEQLQKQMQPEALQKSKERRKKKKESRGIGAQYNKYFDEDLPDDGEDYSKYFKAIDDQDEDAVFVAPDGSVHKLNQDNNEDVDLIVKKLGITAEMFGTKEDEYAPKLVDDTYASNPLATGIDPDVLLAMDDDNAPPLDDDFFAKALDAEMEEDYGDYDDWDDYDSVDQIDESGNHVRKAMSRMSAFSSASHMSHRSKAMDYHEEKVDHLVDTLFGDAHEEEEDDRPAAEIDWGEIADDMKKFTGGIHTNPVPKPTEKVPEDGQKVTTEKEPEEDSEFEEEEEQPKRKEPEFDIRSVVSTMSTTDNLPSRIQDKSKARKKQPKQEEAEPEVPLPPEFTAKEGETKEEKKARKKAIKEYQRQRRQMKKERKAKFAAATVKVKKSIAASGGTRGQRVFNLE